MEPLLAFLSVLGGLLLRLGLPLAVTVLLVWLLRKVDARWQREAEKEWAGAPGVALATPCWQIRQCTPERRAACAAYRQSQVPCWQVFRSSSGQLRESCLDCVVLRSAPVPAVSRAHALRPR